MLTPELPGGFSECTHYWVTNVRDIPEHLVYSSAASFALPEASVKVSSVTNLLGDFDSAYTVFTAHLTLPSPLPPG